MSIATELTRIQTAKANLKTQIEAKGVSVPSTATIDTYATYVQAIPQGGGSATDYLKITNRTATAGTITFTKSGSVHNLVLKLSTDGTNWVDYNMSATTTVVLPANGYVMIDGNNNEYVCYDSNKRWQISADVDHDISGKLSSLIGKSMNPSFGYLFYNDTHLINASGLSLDYTVLAAFAYSNMFQGCTSLVTAPALPATTLSDYCYQNMFDGCSSLVAAPELSATTVAKYCYSNMFKNCSSLTTVQSELPALSLPQNCYNAMFIGCTSLTTAPSIPATGISNYSCSYMFQDCTSLTTAPVLYSAGLASNCYKSMFNGCTSLTSITCLAMTKGTSSLDDWVKNISTTGTLYVADGNSVGWTQGNNGYPATWTLQTYTP